MSENLNFDFEQSWDLLQGSFSTRLANNILIFKDSNKKTIKTALDINCKTANLLNTLSLNNIKCFGYDTNKQIINYSSKKYQKIAFKHSEKIYEIPFKSSFDLITCINDSINDLTSISDISLLFKNVSKHLANHGVFIFDFYTKKKFSKSYINFETSSNADSVIKFKAINSTQASINYIFYLKTEDGLVSKTNKIMRKVGFETNEILEELKKVGFKNITVVDNDLSKIENYDKEEKLYVIAMKK